MIPMPKVSEKPKRMIPRISLVQKQTIKEDEEYAKKGADLINTSGDITCNEDMIDALDLGDLGGILDLGDVSDDSVGDIAEALLMKFSQQKESRERNQQDLAEKHRLRKSFRQSIRKSQGPRPS